MNAFQNSLKLLLLASTIGLMTTPAVLAATPSAALTYRWNQPAFQKQVISLLSMNADGTVRIHDWAGARKLFGKDFAWAMDDLQAYNERLLAGRETRMASIDELAAHAIVLDAPTIARAQAAEEPGFVVASTAPYCRGGWIGVCSGGTCCCGGWWFFCTQWCRC